MILYRKNKKLALFAIGLLFLANLIAWSVVYNISRPGFLEITYFDIGQGDSIFIETPQGHQILIDGGPDSTVLEKLAKEMPFYDKTIDLIILTHPEYDHYYGLFEVLKRYEVENILWTGVVRDTSEWQEWMRLLEREGAQIEIAQAGQRIILQQDPFIFIDILHPFESLAGQEFERANKTSIVAHLFFKNVSFLFTGDITKKIEKQLVARENSRLNLHKFVSLKTDVLKIAHHGSKTSSYREFIEKSLPELAVVQLGRDNRYGHPHPEVLARLEEFGIQVLRTDLNGDIKIISDGKLLEIFVSE